MKPHTKNLEVWKKSIAFVTHIYFVRESFLDSEKFNLLSQIRRAAVSIASNISVASPFWVGTPNI